MGDVGDSGYILGRDGCWRVVVSIFWEVVGDGVFILDSGGSWWICFGWWVYFEMWWVVMDLFWVVVGGGRFILGGGG